MANKQEIRESIKRLRSQMLVHSNLYYWGNVNIISDDEFDKRAVKLVKLQTENPDCCTIGFYDEVFVDWDGGTGSHLPNDEWVVKKANEVFEIYEQLIEGTFKLR